MDDALAHGDLGIRGGYDEYERSWWTPLPEGSPMAEWFKHRWTAADMPRKKAA